MREVEISVEFLSKCTDLELYTMVQGQPILYKRKGEQINQHTLLLEDAARKFYINDDDMSRYIDLQQYHLHAALKKTVHIDVDSARVLLLEQIKVSLDNPRNILFSNMKKIVDMLVDEYLANPSIVVQLTRIALHDYSTQLHSMHVMLYCIGYMCYCKRSRKDVNSFGIAGLLHDVGKIEVPDYLLQAPRKLTHEEFMVVQRHSSAGAAILDSLDLDKSAMESARDHHERLDGTGYPYGKKGDEINEFSKILAIIDTFEALTTWRPYKEPMTPFAALEIIKEDVKAGKLDVGIFKDFIGSAVDMRIMSP